MSNNSLKIVQTINQLEWLIQTDLGHRGIHRIPAENLCTFCQGNLFQAIQFLAVHQGCEVAIVTGFYIPDANPPAPENDGPGGALFLARGLNMLGYHTLLITDEYGKVPLEQGCELFEDELKNTTFFNFPVPKEEAEVVAKKFFEDHPNLKCLISIERVGPCHTLSSFLNQSEKPGKDEIEIFRIKGPGNLAGEYLNMRGIPVTNYTAPIHQIFNKENHPSKSIFSIGIGDGGNEIGMGSIPWRIISENILNHLGGKIACQVPTDATIVSGVSNWAGYSLVAGLCVFLNQVKKYDKIYSEQGETKLIEHYFQTKSAVDGKLGHPALSIDGIDWEIHLKILNLIWAIINI